MIGLVVACGFVLAGGGQQATVSGGKGGAALISNMFKKYASAKTLYGRIRMVQTAQSASVEIDTQVAFERPSFMYLFQRQSDGKQPDASLVSDGVSFAYTPPPELEPRPEKLREAVHPHSGPALTVPDFYGVASASMLDKSFALDTVIARASDLRMETGRLAGFGTKGKFKVGNVDANLIEGAWRSDERHPVQGSFQLYVTDDGDLVRFVLTRTFTIDATTLIKNNLPADALGNGVQVVTTWDVDVKVDQKVDRSIFKVN